MLRAATSSLSRISVVPRGVRAWSASTGKIVVESPYSGETVAEIPLISEASAMKQVDAAAAAQAAWAQSELSQRIAVCDAFLSNVEANKNRIAEVIARKT
jgi:acyl-CoA reductase-like NAD-dependent aldehyde dehydrogenase